MITKVQGKRFVYKFVCDLKTLLGYSPKELAALVLECAAKKAARNAAEMRPNDSEDEDEDNAAAIALQVGSLLLLPSIVNRAPLILLTARWELTEQWVSS